jgi:hypothetical protein
VDENITLLNLATQSPLDQCIEEELKETRKVKANRKALNMRIEKES